jgi:hypothetical protein
MTIRLYILEQTINMIHCDVILFNKSHLLTQQIKDSM